jgi:hypothetical protein
MTFSEFIDAVNDPNQRYGAQNRVFRVTMTPQERADAARLPITMAPPHRPAPTPAPPSRPVWTRSAADELARRRLDQYRRDAEHDALVQRLRRLR